MFRFYMFQWIYLYLKLPKDHYLGIHSKHAKNWYELAIFTQRSGNCNCYLYLQLVSIYESENVNIKLTKYANQLNKRPMGSIIKITVT